MREWYRDIVYGLTLLVASFTAYLAWRGPQAADPPAVQTAASHPIGGLIVVATLFILAGALNSVPLLLRLLSRKKIAANAEDVDAIDSTEGDSDKPDYQTQFLAESDARHKCLEECAAVTIERNQLRGELEQLKTEMLDAIVKDSDPRVDIQFVDDRGHSASSELYYGFDLINRSDNGEAKFLCLESFRIGGHLVKFRKLKPLLKPGASYELYCEIDAPDGRLCKLDIFDVFSQEYEALKNPDLYDYPILIHGFYQDGASNLFEVRCDLVFNYGNHVRKLFGQAITTRNHKYRKVASAIHPIDWSK